MKLDQGRYRTDCDMPLDISIYSQVYIYTIITIEMTAREVLGPAP